MPSHAPEVEWRERRAETCRAAPADRTSALLPWYGWVGMASLLAGEAGLFLDVAPIRMFFYGIAWWSYILLADACVWRRCGASLLRSRPREFWFLAFWSVPLWNLFELLNFRLQNWFYVNAPADQTLALLFNCISYATVLPALFETYLLAGRVRSRKRDQGAPVADRACRPGRIGRSSGSAMLIAPLVWPRVAFPLIWGFAIFLGEPLCYWAGTRTVSLARQLERGDPRPFAAVAAGGFCLRRSVGILELLGLHEVALHRPPPRRPEVVRDASARAFSVSRRSRSTCYVLVNLLNVIRRGRNWESLGRGRSRRTARHRRPRHRAGAGVQRHHVCGHRPMDGQERRADAGGDGGGARGCRGATGAIRREDAAGAAPAHRRRRNASHGSLGRARSRRPSCRRCAPRRRWWTSRDSAP